MRIFWTQKSYRRAIRAELRAMPDASDLMVRYSQNPKLIKAARAAFDNIPGHSYAKLNVTDSSIMFAPVSRAICAFAVGLREEREPLT